MSDQTVGVVLVAEKYNILFLANTKHYTQCVADHIEAVQKNSPHNWYVENPLNNRVLHKLDFSYFDAIGFHYSIRPHDWYYCPTKLYRKLKEYGGLKFLFLQDEYQRVNVAIKAMRELNVGLLFTCVRPELHDVAYNDPALKGMRKVSVLTGYAPAPDQKVEWMPINQRSIDIFYRSRTCPYFVGRVANEKVVIAEEFIKRAERLNLTVDISVQEKDRVYGEEWTQCMSNCRATLATESGASIWDRDGEVERAVDAALLENPLATFEEIYQEVLEPYDGKIMYTAISPRVFEAALLKTPLIMFPGWYNGILEPDVHYIRLEKDFSNIESVVQRLRDDEALTTIADKAFQDLIASGSYAADELGELVTEGIAGCLEGCPRGNKSVPASAISQMLSSNSRSHRFANAANNVFAELKFSVGHFFRLVVSRDCRGKEKWRRLIENGSRYLSYLKPRLKS